METNTQQLHDYLIQEFGIQDFSAEAKAQAIEKISTLIFQSAISRVLSDMSEADQQGFDILMEGNPQAEIVYGFFAEKAPNFQSIVQEEIQKLKQELVKTSA